MKKSIGFLSLLIVIAAVSCTDRTTEVKKETVIEKPAVIVKDVPSKPTSISVDKNGVKVQTKKVDVKVGN